MPGNRAGESMDLEKRSVRVDTKISVSSLWVIPISRSASPGDVLILAHGAGAGMQHEFMADFQQRLGEAGNQTVLFNFPYKEAGRTAPDPRARLEETFEAVIRDVLDSCGHSRQIIIGGKSMGGRIASYLAARDRDRFKALLFLGYPLHPPRRPELLRTTHWKDIRSPALFIQGTRDPFCQLQLLDREVADFGGRAEIYPVEGGDHSFNVPKKLGKSKNEVRAEICSRIQQWQRDI